MGQSGFELDGNMKPLAQSKDEEIRLALQQSVEIQSIGNSMSATESHSVSELRHPETQPDSERVPEKEKRKNDGGSEGSVSMKVKVTIGIVIVVIISIRLLFPEFDVLKGGILNGIDIGCLINFGNCSNNEGESVNTPSSEIGVGSSASPTFTPILPTLTFTPLPPTATFTLVPPTLTFTPLPSPTPFDCNTSFASAQNATLKITVDYVDAEKNNVDLNLVTIGVTVENFTDSEVSLPLLNNLVIFRSGTTEVIGSPDIGMSSWSSTLSPKANVGMRIVVASLSDKESSIDMKFLFSIADGVPEKIDLLVRGVSIPC